MRKTKYYLSLNAAESYLALSKRMDTVDIDRLIRKLSGKKGWWF